MTFWRGSWLQSQACHKCRLYDFDEIALDCVPGQVAWDLVGHVCISRCRVIQQSDGNISKIQYRTPSNNVSGGKTILDPRDFPTHRCLPSEKNKPCLKTRRYLIEPIDWSKEGVFTLHFYKQQVRDVNFSPNSSWAEWGSQFLLETPFVPSWFAGSSWFRLGFRCLSPFFFLLSFLRKGVLFCSIMICWFLLVPAGVPVLVSLLLFFLSSGKGFCSIMICWFLLVPAGVPVLVSLLLSSCFRQERGSVPSWISWFLLVPAGVPVLVALLLSSFLPQEKGSVHHGFPGSSFFWWGFRCLSPFFSLLSFLRKRVLFHHGFLGSSCFGLGFRCLSPFFSLFFVCQTVPWILNCTWPWWKHALLLFGVYAGVIFECFCIFLL